MTAQRLSPADEVVELRAEIARLQRREAALQALLDDQPARPALRQGWPIHRSRPSQAPPGHA